MQEHGVHIALRSWGMVYDAWGLMRPWGLTTRCLHAVRCRRTHRIAMPLQHPITLYYLDYHLGSPLNTHRREKDPTFDLNLTRFVRILRCENLTFQLISELCWVKFTVNHSTRTWCLCLNIKKKLSLDLKYFPWQLTQKELKLTNQNSAETSHVISNVNALFN